MVKYLRQVCTNAAPEQEQQEQQEEETPTRKTVWLISVLLKKLNLPVMVTWLKRKWTHRTFHPAQFCALLLLLSLFPSISPSHALSPPLQAFNAHLRSQSGFGPFSAVHERTVGIFSNLKGGNVSAAVGAYQPRRSSRSISFRYRKTLLL